MLGIRLAVDVASVSCPARDVVDGGCEVVRLSPVRFWEVEPHSQNS